MRVNLAAAFGAIAGLWLALAGSARHPAQVVVAFAAGCAFLGVVSLRGRASAEDWFTVRLLLAANIAVFGISEDHSREAEEQQCLRPSSCAPRSRSGSVDLAARRCSLG